MMSIRHAIFPQDTPEVLRIWREYVASPRVSLDFQDNDAEFSNLPGKYALPHGCLLLGQIGRRIQGCVALRRIDNAICEMKRLYVRPGARKSGMGRKLVETLIIEAKRAGYAEMRLDVLPEFTAAQKLYTELGFTSAEPVSFNPVPGSRFLGLRLRQTPRK